MSLLFLPLSTLLVLASSPANAVCPTPLNATELIARIDQAELAYGAEDLERFRAQREQILDDLPCLSELLTRGQVARVHRLEGLAMHLERSPEQAALAFAAARYADTPSALLPVTVVPDDPNLPERIAFAAESLVDQRWVAVPLPPGGILSFDGAADAMRPERWPTLFQAELAGQLTLTAYLWPDEPLPPIPAPAPLDTHTHTHVDDLPLELPPKVRPTRVATLTVGAGSLATAAVGAAYYLGFWRVYREQCAPVPDARVGVRDCSAAEATQPGYYQDVLAPHHRLALGLMATGGAGLALSGLTLSIQVGDRR